MSSKHIIEATEDNFETEVINSSVPVLVDFWAPWCGPCKAIAPTLEELAQDLAGKAKIAKINVDDHAELAKRYGIRSIPTLMVFKDGNAVATKVGSQSKAQLTAMLELDA